MFIFLLKKGIYKKLNKKVYFLPVLAVGNQHYDPVDKVLITMHFRKNQFFFMYVMRYIVSCLFTFIR